MASRLPHAKGFTDLLAYQAAREVARHLFELSKGFPAGEQFSLTDQLRRSSRAVGAQIAEAWAKRRYPRHFVSKLTDADAEQQETRHWISVAAECGYLSADDSSDLVGRLDEVGRMIQGMIRKADAFAGPPEDRIGEAQAEYLVSCGTSNEPTTDD